METRSGLIYPKIKRMICVGCMLYGNNCDWHGNNMKTRSGLILYPKSYPYF